MNETDGSLRIKTRIDNSEVDKDIQKTAQKLDIAKKEAEIASSKVKDLNDKLNLLAESGAKEVDMAPLRKQIDMATIRLEKAENKVTDLQDKLDELDSKKLGSVSGHIDNITNSTENTIKKVIKWGAALFSVRTIYNVLSKLGNTYLSENEEIANKLASTWGVLAEILSPIIDFMINVFSKAVGYLAVFIKALTGIDIIARRNEKALKKQAKAQKELNNEMAAFDEMTKLQDKQNAVTSVDSSTSFVMPELNPEIVQKIQDFASKIRDLKTAWDELDPSVRNILVLLGVAGLLSILTGKPGLILGVSTLILGIDGLNKIFSEDLTESVKGLIELLGVAGLIGILTGNGGVAGAIGGVVLALFGLNEMINGDTGEAIEGLILLIGGSGLAGAFLGGIKGVGLGMAISSVIAILKGFNDLLSNDTTDSIKGFIELVVGAGGLVVAINLIKGGANAGLLGLINPLSLVIVGITAFAAGIALVTKNWSRMNGIEKTISILGLIAVGAATAAAAVGALQSAWSLGIAAAAIVAGTAAIAISVSNANKRAQENIPKLATGGIINNPGRGVPIGGAIGGEAGAEGVIPLTDSQAMETLGEAIGKYITINANITNNMNGRVISRQLKKIQANNDFAYNT